MKTKPSLKHSIAFLGLIIGVFSFFFKVGDLTPLQSKVAGLSVVTIGLLATAVIPEYLTALIFLLIAILFNLAPANIVFSGFDSTAFWLVFGGLVAGVAIRETGLGERFANKLTTWLSGSYWKLITCVTFLGVFLDFIMPSAMGRVVLLVPVMLSLADNYGFRQGSNGRKALLLASILGTYIPAYAILPSNVPNMILAGLAEDQHHITFYYGEYLLLHFPVMGIVKAVLIALVMVWFFPDTPNANAKVNVEKKPFSRNEQILVYSLVVMLLLWMTDFMHHISPAWVSLGGAIFLMLPGVGVVEKSSFSQKINYGSLFFIAGLIGLGSVIHYSRLGEIIGKQLIAVLPLKNGQPFINYMSVSLSSTITGLLTTIPGVPAIMTPLASDLAHFTGFSVKSILMQQVVGFGTVILPYEAPPVVVALLISNEKATCVIKPLILIAIVSIFVLMPLNYCWWNFLGWL